MGIAILALFATLGFGSAPNHLGQARPPMRLTLPIQLTDVDLGGTPLRVFPAGAKRGVVAFFVLGASKDEARDAPEFKRLAHEYSAKGWRFYLVYTGGGIYSPKARMEAAEALRYPFPVVRDDVGLFQLGHITLAPEAAVFNRRGRLLYHGRIDDGFDAAGRPHKSPVSHYLSQALDAIDGGRPVSPAYVAPVGAFIPID